MPRSATGTRTRRLAATLALSLGLALPAASARALDLDVGPPHVREGRLWIVVQLSEPFAPRVEESLSRGMPARLLVTAELWHSRTGWFDRLLGSYEVGLKVRYDLWTHRFRIEGPAPRSLAVSTLDSVRLALSAPMELPLAPVDRLSARGRYYVVASATLKPLSVEDVEEGEGWLSGEVADKRRSGLGILTAIPRSVFDAVRNFAGLGDQRARVVSGEFGADELRP